MTEKNDTLGLAEDTRGLPLIDPCSVSDWLALESMCNNGGGFVKRLADAWMRADRENFIRLRSVFGYLLDKYGVLAENKRVEAAMEARMATLKGQAQE